MATFEHLARERLQLVNHPRLKNPQRESELLEDIGGLREGVSAGAINLSPLTGGDQRELSGSEYLALGQKKVRDGSQDVDFALKKSFHFACGLLGLLNSQDGDTVRYIDLSAAQPNSDADLIAFTTKMNEAWCFASAVVARELSELSDDPKIFDWFELQCLKGLDVVRGWERKLRDDRKNALEAKLGIDRASPTATTPATPQESLSSSEALAVVAQRAAEGMGS